VVKSKILLISDMCGYGKVAAACQMPIFSYMGHDVFNLPTMLISNTFPYGKFAILESTDYIQEAMSKWNELGFSFDAIVTGFMASERQAQLVAHYCREQASLGTKIYVDPVMGDYGKMYAGANEGTIRCMREMLSAAHLCFPNYTEACLLTGVEYRHEGITWDEAKGLINKLRRIGSMSVLVTSCIVDGKPAVIGYNHFSAEYLLLPYEVIYTTNTPSLTGEGRGGAASPVQFPGTGDIFSSIIVGRLQDGDTLQHATQTSMDTLRHWIDLNKDNEDKNRGIPVERHLGDL
jgi:pyridoxine kinase